jgi:hypothetical protein
MFGYDSFTSDSLLEGLLNRYARDKRAVSVDFRKLVPCLTSAERATHLLHPYPAKLLVHIPFFFLSNSLLSKAGDRIADPFCGSGTVLLEAQLSGRHAIGADSNPLARLLTKVKTCPIELGTLDQSTVRLFARLPSQPRGPMPDVVNLDHWFYPHVAHQLLCLSEAIHETRNPDVRDYFRVCFSSCVKKVSLSDPRLSVPVRLKEGQYPKGHVLREKTDAHLRRLRRINVFDAFRTVLAANRRRLSTLVALKNWKSTAEVVSSDARSLSTTEQLRVGSTVDGVKLIITSPPYPGAQKYIRSSSLSLGWLGMCSSSELFAYKQATIGREEFRFEDYASFAGTQIVSADRILKDMHAENPVRAAIAGTYLREMRDALLSMWNILHIGGFLVLVAANNRIAGREFRTQHFLRLIAEEIGFTTELRLVDAIRSRGLMTKRNKTASVITREWVLVFSKGGH